MLQQLLLPLNLGVVCLQVTSACVVSCLQCASGGLAAASILLPSLNLLLTNDGKEEPVNFAANMMSHCVYGASCFVCHGIMCPAAVDRVLLSMHESYCCCLCSWAVCNTVGSHLKLLQCHPCAYSISDVTAQYAVSLHHDHDMQAGLSGAIAIHAIYSTDETVLFFERPHVGAANSGVVPNPYLTVRPPSLLRPSSTPFPSSCLCSLLYCTQV